MDNYVSFILRRRCIDISGWKGFMIFGVTLIVTLIITAFISDKASAISFVTIFIVLLVVVKILEVNDKKYENKLRKKLRKRLSLSIKRFIRKNNLDSHIDKDLVSIDEIDSYGSCSEYYYLVLLSNGTILEFDLSQTSISINNYIYDKFTICKTPIWDIKPFRRRKILNTLNSKNKWLKYSNIFRKVINALRIFKPITLLLCTIHFVLGVVEILFVVFIPYFFWLICGILLYSILSRFNIGAFSHGTCLFLSYSIVSIVGVYFNKIAHKLIKIFPNILKERRNDNASFMYAYKLSQIIFCGEISDILISIAYLLFLLLSTYFKLQCGTPLINDTFDFSVNKAFLVYIAFRTIVGQKRLPKAKLKEIGILCLKILFSTDNDDEFNKYRGEHPLA